MVRMAFAETGIEIEFNGLGSEEKAHVAKCNHPDYQLETGKDVLEVDPNYFRPTEVDLLVGDAAKAKKLLGWEPEYNLQDLVTDMVQSDLRLVKKDKFLKDHGYGIEGYFNFATGENNPHE